MTRRCRCTGLLLGTLVAIGTGARASDDAACIATASLDRAEVTIAEQVVYRVHTLRRADVTAADWTLAPSFRGFRAVWLSERPTGESVLRGHHRYTAREERYALFPERAGVLSVRAPELRCVTGAGAGAQTSIARVPALTLPVHPLPGDAPPSFDGLVGPVTLQTLVTPRAIRLGESVRVAVAMRSEGALWNVRDPLGDVPGADVFRRRPEVATESGQRLVVKRNFAYDVVPLREGSLILPGFRVAYYDPATRRFDHATSAETSVSVGARREGDAAPLPRAARAAPASVSPADRPAGDAGAGGWGRTAVVIAAVLLLAVGAAAARRRRRKAAVWDPAAEGAEALAGALRSALARHLPGASTLSAEEIRGHPELPPRAVRAADLLVATDRARFDPDAATPGRDSVGEAIASL